MNNNILNNSIIFGTACFGSVFLCTMSLNQLNKLMLHENKNKIPLSLYILNSSIMITSGAFFLLLLNRSYKLSFNNT